MLKTNKIILSANRAAWKIAASGKFNVLRTKSYVAATTLPIPQNIDVAETTRFSPQRTRDISANQIISHQSQTATPAPVGIDITADNTSIGNIGFGRSPHDPHVQSYDCQNPVSLNALMQSNVPQPYGGTHKFSHLNMPGGQWSQEGKFIAQNLQSSHYTTLRDNARASWVSYGADAKKALKLTSTNVNIQRRFYSNEHAKVETPGKVEELSKKEQLKRAFKEYGTTVIVFHVAISLASLGGFYLLVSNGINVMPILEYLGIGTTALANKVAAGASTFVIAYAVHKVFAPVRISMTLGATPFIVRYLRSKGILKPNNPIQK